MSAMLNILLSQKCDHPNCTNLRVGRGLSCDMHAALTRKCQAPGCGKCAQGSTKFCIAHGGGRRCTFPSCTKGARDKFFCAAHGGGKRCVFPDCIRSAVGGTNICTSHGGGRKCCYDGCTKSAQSPTDFCVRHGGGKQCEEPHCLKVARGRTNKCAAHGGGNRCEAEGCMRICVVRSTRCRWHHIPTASSSYSSSSDSNSGSSPYQDESVTPLLSPTESVPTTNQKPGIPNWKNKAMFNAINNDLLPSNFLRDIIPIPNTEYILVRCPGGVDNTQNLNTIKRLTQQTNTVASNHSLSVDSFPPRPPSDMNKSFCQPCCISPFPSHSPTDTMSGENMNVVQTNNLNTNHGNNVNISSSSHPLQSDENVARYPTSTLTMPLPLPPTYLSSYQNDISILTPNGSNNPDVCGTYHGVFNANDNLIGNLCPPSRMPPLVVIENAKKIIACQKYATIPVPVPVPYAFPVPVKNISPWTNLQQGKYAQQPQEKTLRGFKPASMSATGVLDTTCKASYQPVKSLPCSYVQEVSQISAKNYPMKRKHEKFDESIFDGQDNRGDSNRKVVKGNGHVKMMASRYHRPTMEKEDLNDALLLSSENDLITSLLLLKRQNVEEKPIPLLSSEMILTPTGDAQGMSLMTVPVPVSAAATAV